MTDTPPRSWQALAVLPASAAAAVATLADRPLRYSLLSDDAFYYLQVGHNVAHRASSTFNGISETNGYQPLWQALVAAVQIFAARDAAVTILSFIGAACWIATVVVASRTMPLIRRRRSVLFGTCALAGYCVIGPRLSFSGMESALVILLLMVVTRRWLYVASHEPSVRDAQFLGAALSLLLLTRLDSGAFILTMSVAVAIAWRGRPDRFRLLAWLIGPAVGAGVAYVAVNLAVFGTPVAISAIAKSRGGFGWNSLPLHQVVGLEDLYQLPRGLAAATIVLGVISVVALKDGHVAGRLPGARSLLVALLGSIVIQLGYFSLSTLYGIWPWYTYLLAPTLFLSVVVASEVLQRGERNGRVEPAWIAVAMVSLLTAADVGRTDAYTAAALEVAERLEPHEAVGAIAVGDRAGVLCYAVRLPCVQLEGLVEDRDFVDTLRNGFLATELSERGVTLYARVRGDEARPDGSGHLTFLEPAQSRGRRQPIVVTADAVVADTGPGPGFSLYRYAP